MGDALGGLQDAHEGGSVDRVAPETRVHQTTCVVQGAQGSRRQTFDAHRFLVQQKSFQNGFWMTLVQPIVHHFQHA